MTSSSNSRIDLCKQLIRSHLLFIIILIVAVVVWSYVFSLSATDLITDGSQPYRAVWNGSGNFDLFGYTVYVNFEGYLDYDYYYNSWGQQFVSGLSPYTDAFNRIEIEGMLYNTPYFFPPLYVYMCALGVSLPMGPFGIGFLLTFFGYITAIPIYGISTYLSQNNRVGAVAAATYLFNPVVLYHTVFEWLNPAPFVFFAMLSFFLLMRGNRLSGTLAMAASALFKQTAFFLALPLIAYLLRKPPVKNPVVPEEELKPPGDDLDPKGFAKKVVYVLIFVGAVSLPYLTDISNYIYYIFQRPGGLLLSDVTVFPDPSQPISFAVLLISLNVVIQNLNVSLGIALPEIPESIIQLVNLGSYYSVFLILMMIPLLLKMLLLEKDDTNLRQYWSKMIFFTLLLMLCLHLFSPRGIYKYYCVLLIPFFSIISVSNMITQRTEKTGLSIFMILNPILFGFLILFPSRYVYLAYLILILVAYLAHKQFSLVLEIVATELRKIPNRLRKTRTSVMIENESSDEVENIPNS
ncbi:hypothetical protein E4H12_04900 [Candidatus Thorarchaeota archaeon]|nr:MAG: hypothetical protein E4H12_04900 [Candidatus Thorarchaeota archaeon]